MHAHTYSGKRQYEQEACSSQATTSISSSVRNQAYATKVARNGMEASIIADRPDKEASKQQALNSQSLSDRSRSVKYLNLLVQI